MPKSSKGDYKSFLNGLLKKPYMYWAKIKGSTIAIQYIEGKLFKSISKKLINVTYKIKGLKMFLKISP